MNRAAWPVSGLQWLGELVDLVREAIDEKPGSDAPVDGRVDRAHDEYLADVRHRCQTRF